MKIEWNYGNSEELDCFLVRKKVFVDEQGFSQDNEFDTTDEVSYHLCAYSDIGEAIGAARIFIDEAYNGDGICYHCGRICVISDVRGSGIGEDIMRELDKKALELGATVLVLSAQVRAKGFYTKLGYKEEGEEYLDEHCPHVMMRKIIE